MADILIKGMEMPKCCGVCPLRVDGLHTFQCMRLLGRAYTYELAEQRQEDCPLVEIPPHGRIIDADLAIKNLDKYYCKECDNWNGVKCKTCDHYWAMQVLEDAPTVLEANND